LDRGTSRTTSIVAVYLGFLAAALKVCRKIARIAIVRILKISFI
jgi:hypothetical protein